MTTFDNRRDQRSVHLTFGWLTALLLLFANANTAHASGRAQLLMFESATCEWCKLWHAEIGPIYPKSEEGQAAPLRTVSIHSSRPDDLKAVTGIVYTPTFVLWDGDREVGRILGYGGEIQFWGLLGELLKKHKERVKMPIGPLPADRKALRGTPIEDPQPKAR